MPLMLEVDESMREAGSKGGLEDGDAGNPKPKQGRTGGKEGEGNAGGKKKLDSIKKNGELKAVLTLMLKTQLRGEQRLRELEGITMMTFVGAASAGFLNEVSCQTQTYQTRVKGKKDHGLGPPHIYAFQGFLGGLERHHSNELGSKNLGELKELKKKTEEMTWKEVAEVVGIFKVSKVYDKEKKRLTIALAPHLLAERKLLSNCLDQLGWDKKEGKAPPSHMERELQSFLEELMGK